MSRTKRDILDTESMLERLATTLQLYGTGNDCYEARADAESLRRISVTLRRWHELECGVDGGCIERGYYKPQFFTSDENGHPYWADHSRGATRYTKMPDREKGALARLAAIMARYPALQSYVQGDPRGASLYILRPGDVPKPVHANVDSYYSRGLAVHQ